MKKILFIAATVFLSASLVLTANTVSACDKDGKKDKKEASCSKSKAEGKSCCSKTAAHQTDKAAATPSISTASVTADAVAVPARAATVDAVTPASADAPTKTVTAGKK